MRRAGRSAPVGPARCSARALEAWSPAAPRRSILAAHRHRRFAAAAARAPPSRRLAIPRTLLPARRVPARAGGGHAPRGHGRRFLLAPRPSFQPRIALEPARVARVSVPGSALGLASLRLGAHPGARALDRATGSRFLAARRLDRRADRLRLAQLAAGPPVGARHDLELGIGTRRHAPLAGAGAGPADRQVAGRRAVAVLPAPAGWHVAGRRRRLVAPQVRAPERVPAAPAVPGRVTVAGVGAVEGRAVAPHDIDVVRDTAV